MAGRRATRSEIRDSGIVVKCIRSIFNLVGFNVISGLFVALSSKWLVTQQRLVVEQNGVKFGTQGH